MLVPPGYDSLGSRLAPAGVASCSKRPAGGRSPFLCLAAGVLPRVELISSSLERRTSKIKKT
jgi:hypothetical protein